MATPLSTDRRLATLEREVAELRAGQGGAGKRDPYGKQRRQVRLAVTVPEGSSGGSYPAAAPANVFPIKFLDGTFPETAGEQSPTLTQRSADSQAVAMSLIGYVPVFTQVFVVFDNGRWWIIESPDPCPVRERECLPFGGNGILEYDRIRFPRRSAADCLVDIKRDTKFGTFSVTAEGIDGGGHQAELGGSGGPSGINLLCIADDVATIVQAGFYLVTGTLVLEADDSSANEVLCSLSEPGLFPTQFQNRYASVANGHKTTVAFSMIVSATPALGLLVRFQRTAGSAQITCTDGEFDVVQLVAGNYNGVNLANCYECEGGEGGESSGSGAGEDLGLEAELGGDCDCVAGQTVEATRLGSRVWFFSVEDWCGVAGVTLWVLVAYDPGLSSTDWLFESGTEPDVGCANSGVEFTPDSVTPFEATISLVDTSCCGSGTTLTLHLTGDFFP